MFFRIRKSYKSSLSLSAIKAYIESLESKESGIWILKRKDYEVSTSGNSFSLRKRSSGGKNSTAYPLIRGEMTEGEYVRINLDIKPAYYLIAFCAIFPCVFLPAIIFVDKMTINGVYRSPELGERILFSLFPIAIPGTICYFKSIKPVQDAEIWLIRKLKLEPIYGC